jgi:hypothetical protein
VSLDACLLIKQVGIRITIDIGQREFRNPLALLLFITQADSDSLAAVRYSLESHIDYNMGHQIGSGGSGARRPAFLRFECFSESKETSVPSEDLPRNHPESDTYCAQGHPICKQYTPNFPYSCFNVLFIKRLT